METELVYLHDAYRRELEATVVDRRPDAVALDRTIFYPTGGGQPHDTGRLHPGPAGPSVAGLAEVTGVTGVTKEGTVVWHQLDGPPPEVGAVVRCELDWDRRHQLMRAHSAMHVLCGVIWNRYGRAVTGGNMEPLGGRMDFEFDPLPEGFAQQVSEAVNAEIAADRPIEVSFLPRGRALADDALIRTKVNLIPDSVQVIRVVDIVGLDRQADGGTHVARTGEIGRFEIVKTESKGKGNKRVRIALS